MAASVERKQCGLMHDADSYANPNPYTDANAHTDSHADADAYTHPHANA